MRAALMLTWMLSIPTLVVLSARSWLVSSGAPLTTWRRFLGVSSLVQLSVGWVAFIVLFGTGQIGGFGSHFMTTRLADWFLLLSFSGFVTGVFLQQATRMAALSAGFLLTALWFGAEMVA